MKYLGLRIRAARKLCKYSLEALGGMHWRFRYVYL